MLSLHPQVLPRNVLNLLFFLYGSELHWTWQESTLEDSYKSIGDVKAKEHCIGLIDGHIGQNPDNNIGKSFLEVVILLIQPILQHSILTKERELTERVE